MAFHRGPTLTMGDYLKAALYFEECAEQEPRPTERARLLRAARQFRWLEIAAERQADPTSHQPKGRTVPARLPDAYRRSNSGRF